MISNFDNCLFVHIPKVAGQSIELAFLERASLTWEQRASFLLKPNRHPEVGPPRLAHLTASEYLRYGYLSPNAFRNMFKFSFVRNPFDRLVSEFLYRKYKCSFKSFVFKQFPTYASDDYNTGLDLYRHVIPQYKFLYNEDGELLVDYVGKFETLTEDFRLLSTKITGKPFDLPYKNRTEYSGVRSIVLNKFKPYRKKHYSLFYDEETREFVSELYKKDLELFDYVFDNNPISKG